MKNETATELARVLAGATPPIADGDWGDIERCEAQGVEWSGPGLAAWRAHPGRAPDPAPEPYTPATTGDADWCAALLGAIDTELLGKREQANLWHQQIDQWLADETRGPVLRRTFLERALQRWGRKQRAEDPELRTMRLPSGGAVAATVPKSGAVVVTDQEAAVLYLRACAEEAPNGSGYSAAIKVTPDQVRLPELRKVFGCRRWPSGWAVIDKATGAIVPDDVGLAVEPPAEATYRVSAP